MSFTILTIWRRGRGGQDQGVAPSNRGWDSGSGDSIDDGVLCPYNSGDSEILVEFKGNRMTLECSIWDDIGQGYANLVALERIARNPGVGELVPDCSNPR